MDRIRAEEPKKVIPLFKRPQIRALAGLAACLVLAVGLYGASRPRHLDKTEKMDMAVRSFSQDAAEETADLSACAPLDGAEDGPQVNIALADPETADAPQIAAHAAPEPAVYDGAKQAGGADVEAVDTLPEERLSDSAIMVLEWMPEGAEELIPPETAVTYNPATGEEGYRWPDVQGEPETLAQIERLAGEQGMCVERSSRPAEEALYHLVILQPNQ